MLNLNTTLLMVTVTISLQGLIWILVWLTQRHLFELRFIAAGFLSVAGGMLIQGARDIMPLPPAVTIITLNYLIHCGAALVAHGLARFLNQRGNPPLIIGTVIFIVAFWPVALALAPENVAIRILASNGITTVLLFFMCWTLLQDRIQPRLLRWTMIGVLLSDVVALSLRSFIAINYMDDQVALVHPGQQAWYFFYFNIFMTGLFLLLLLMVGVRLSRDLRQKNDDLSREVTQRRELQNQLSSSLDTAKALHEEQKQLLRMVTHEFRTPLAVVDRAAEMIDVVLDRPPETVSRRLDSIRDAVRRLVQLIDRFLDVERRDLNVLQTERIDIASLLDRVRKHFAGLELDLRLRFTVQPNLSFYWGDPEMLCTVLINLIDNALKYTTDGSPVDIAARAEDNAIVITVTDRGIGIPEAEAALIGRRFFRASNTTPATGTGIGLYNTRRLLEYHNGILSLRAGRGSGTVATIRLPLPGVVPDVSMEVA
ncbi:HAMP domain-containing sensor histidine kinase [Ferrovibrio sp.]|uniref:sensor histidine kinase n=1 Tax=Ferrovibrio sp. TaxID=1917215 RepID=UPI000CA8800A|nr:HAMP domain-containing sensor histidine kinase [Ferrovibrio sp.]PJI43336.1 MAG: two-component sensor histidine kinase [Ferrovibrio sp.]